MRICLAYNLCHLIKIDNLRVSINFFYILYKFFFIHVKLFVIFLDFSVIAHRSPDHFKWVHLLCFALFKMFYLNCFFFLFLIVKYKFVDILINVLLLFVCSMKFYLFFFLTCPFYFLAIALARADFNFSSFVIILSYCI